MFAEHFSQIYELTLRMQENLYFLLIVMGSLWIFHFINMALGYRLNVFGIHPRKPYGVVGIPLSPFLHGDFNHLFFNSIPLFVFANFILLGGPVFFLNLSAVLIILSGTATWIFGRPGVHIGASSLCMAYLGYLLADAYHEQTIVTVLIGFACIYYFGAMLFSIVPTRKSESWEGHLSGLVSGIFASFLFPFPY